MSLNITDPLFILTIVVPMLCFFFGILVSDVLRLHDMRRLHLYVMGIPTGLFIVGMLVNSARVEVATTLADDVVSTEAQYGFLQDHPDYMIFAAIVIFMGTSTPALFRQLRSRFSQPPDA
jgi:hypothetical protein